VLVYAIAEGVQRAVLPGCVCPVVKMNLILVLYVGVGLVGVGVLSVDLRAGEGGC
jgi:hypothetical protein